MSRATGHSSDEMLLAGAKAGDRRALERLLSRHQRRVYRFGLSMCRDEEDARDVVQDTLLAVARGVRDFRGGSSLSTWLYTIARSFCIKKRRRSRFAPAAETSLEGQSAAEAGRIADAGRGPDDSLAGREVQAALERAIGRLEPMYREALLLRDVEGLTATEAARALGLSVAAVKSRLHRARLAVRESVAPALGISEPAPPPAPLAEACPDIPRLFSRHLEGEISPRVCEEMEKHLAACDRCRSRCDSLRRTLAACRRTPLPRVPPQVQSSVKQALRTLLEARS